ncbi:MAG: acyltransferase, partial [Tannerellaceae bacterium]|nr:acyltransferase [Tannerellaceae bacterium]
MKYKEDIAEFLPDNEANARINRLYQHISNSNKLIVNFSTKDTSESDRERIMEAIDRFALLLTEEDSLHSIPGILSQIDEGRIFEVADFIQQNIPYFLTEADYSRMDSLLRPANSIASILEEDKRLLMLPSGGMMKQNIVADPLHLFSPVLEKLKDFQAGNQEEINEGYIFSHSRGLKGKVIITSPYGVS